MIEVNLIRFLELYLLQEGYNISYGCYRKSNGVLPIEDAIQKWRHQYNNISDCRTANYAPYWPEPDYTILRIEILTTDEIDIVVKYHLVNDNFFKSGGII